jgi:hypothetical protein
VFLLSTVLVYLAFPLIPTPINSYRQRSGCSCSRHELPLRNLTTRPLSLCSIYATHRGPHQRIIAISLFGPKENKMFQFNRSLTFLHELIQDMNRIYPDNFTLRVYHDDTIHLSDVICPIECKHPNVDFCSVHNKLFIPPKIWRFIPAGDPLVDISESHQEERCVSTTVSFLASDES